MACIAPGERRQGQEVHIGPEEGRIGRDQGGIGEGRIDSGGKVHRIGLVEPDSKVHRIGLEEPDSPGSEYMDT